MHKSSRSGTTKIAPVNYDLFGALKLIVCRNTLYALTQDRKLYNINLRDHDDDSINDDWSTSSYSSNNSFSNASFTETINHNSDDNISMTDDAENEAPLHKQYKKWKMKDRCEYVIDAATA